MSCIVVGCKSHSSRKENDAKIISFHRFPSDVDMRQKLINAIARNNWEWKKQHRICSKHFSDDCFNNIGHKWRRLKIAAVPSLHLRKEEFMSTEFVAVCSQGSDDDEMKFANEPVEEEWHMDFMPTGYLPDSVYRELAWYGILQIQPLHHSAKYRMAAQLIWQHTLGRPHVIMENPPQSTQSAGKVSRQILAEEAAKWSREQRAAQEVLMENIKSGGNGLTVRTVISAHKKTVYIIQNGNYYKCPHGSEPDLDAYRLQANMHERKCTFGKQSIPVPLDPCLEAEVAPIEYSFSEGWMFCLGNGERENNYFQNGTLDCGNKTKISFDKFLEECAIDNNIVITFDYFGDEPRKDMMHNATLCTTWDPCRLSYLYRLESPPPELAPTFPTTTENPCDTTVCPECLDEEVTEGGYVLSDDIFDSAMKS